MSYKAPDFIRCCKALNNFGIESDFTVFLIEHFPKGTVQIKPWSIGIHRLFSCVLKSINGGECGFLKIILNSAELFISNILSNH